MLLSGLAVVLIVAAGIGLTYTLPLRLRVEERLAIGAVVGVVAFCVTTFVTFLLMGMNWATVAFGLVVPCGGALVAVRRAGASPRGELAHGWARMRLPARKAASLRPFAVVSLAGAVVATRTLSLAYQTTGQGITVGNLAVYGDWSAHLAYAGSFAYGDNRSLGTPLASGSPLRYHFLADYFAAPFTVTGATLPQALTLSAWVLAIAFTPLLLCAVQRLTGSRLTAAVALLLFTLSGGAGAWYFARDLQSQGWAALDPIPRTYARMPEHGIWLDNTISLSLYAQRSTLLGLCLGLSALILLLAARVTWARSGFVAAGVLIGVTGIAHVHMLLSALALGALALLFDRRREWWWFLVPAACIGLPMAWAISPPTSEMRWLVGWMAVEEGQLWPAFWWRNAGLFLPAFLLVAVLGLARRRMRRLSMPLWLWFIAANLISFHPWSGNNVKFFMFWQLAGCIVLADVGCRAWRSARRSSLQRWAVRPALVLLGLGLVATGTIDTVRGMQRDASSAWVAADEVEVAGWLRDHASSGDVLVYGASNTSAIAALGGVPAVSGYSGWTADLGLPDWYQRVLDSGAILRGDTEALELAEEYGVVWVAIGPRERFEFDASDEFWADHGELVVEHGDYRLYRID